MTWLNKWLDKLDERVGRMTYPVGKSGFVPSSRDDPVYTITWAYRGTSPESVVAYLGMQGRGARIVIEKGESAFIEAARRVGP